MIKELKELIGKSIDVNEYEISKQLIDILRDYEDRKLVNGKDTIDIEINGSTELDVEEFRNIIEKELIEVFTNHKHFDLESLGEPINCDSDVSNSDIEQHLSKPVEKSNGLTHDYESALLNLFSQQEFKGIELTSHQLYKAIEHYFNNTWSDFPTEYEAEERGKCRRWVAIVSRLLNRDLKDNSFAKFFTKPTPRLYVFNR